MMVQIHPLAPKIVKELRQWEGEYHYPAGLLERAAAIIWYYHDALNRIGLGNVDVEKAIQIARDTLRLGGLPGGKEGFDPSEVGSNPTPVAKNVAPSALLHQALLFLEMVPSWPLDDRQGLNYHAMQHARELRQLESEVAATVAKEIGSPTCECGAPAVCCANCAVADYQAAHPECRICCLVSLGLGDVRIARLRERCGYCGTDHSELAPSIGPDVPGGGANP
jgi:hypothetical protein